ncbi:MAG: flagellar biosynthesis protein FlhB [Spirochaetes bacterium]|nr:flagellar biosynthesis protein FlhB [Spirochaetota bacterium]
MPDRAVAVKYDPAFPAPFVAAKGQGYLAQRIREIADASGIPIQEGDASTEMLYAVDVGGYIPEDLYEVVARLLVYAYQVETQNR